LWGSSGHLLRDQRASQLFKSVWAIDNDESLIDEHESMSLIDEHESLIDEHESLIDEHESLMNTSH